MKMIDKKLLNPNPKIFFKAGLLIMLSFIIINIIILSDNILLNYFLGILLGNIIGAHSLFVHELLHGAITRNKRIQTIYSLISFFPFLMTPSYWRYWHNYLHHSNTQVFRKDPDLLPLGEEHEYFLKKNKIYKYIHLFLPNSKSKLKIFYCFFWMNFQSLLGHFYIRFNGKAWSKLNHKKVNKEITIQIVLLFLYIFFIGIKDPISLILLPFLSQNFTIMSFISTNHHGRDIIKDGIIENEVEYSNNIIMNKFFRMYYFNFGNHIEHHLFPSAPSSSLDEINKIIKPKNNYKKYHMLYNIFIKK